MAISAPIWLAPALGGLIALAEGLRTLFGLQDAYPAYRRAAENLRNEAWLFAQRAARYTDAANPAQLLAERIVEISDTENQAWAGSVMQRKL